MAVRLPTVLSGLLARRAVAGRDPVELARASVRAGCLVAFDVEGPGLVQRIRDAGLAASVEGTVRVDRSDASARLAALAADAGLSVVLAGAPADVDAVDLPDAGVLVPAGEAGAEERCRALAGRRIRLVEGRGRAAALALVRCLDVLMAAEGRLGVAVSDARLIAIAGERAAWYGRPSDSWELVMPFGVLPIEQRRLVAAGRRLRVALPAGGRA